MKSTKKSRENIQQIAAIMPGKDRKLPLSALATKYPHLQQQCLKIQTDNYTDEFNSQVLQVYQPLQTESEKKEFLAATLQNMLLMLLIPSPEATWDCMKRHPNVKMEHSGNEKESHDRFIEHISALRDHNSYNDVTVEDISKMLLKLK